MLPTQNDKVRPVWLQTAIDLFDKDSRQDGDILSHDWIKFALDISSASSIDEADEAQWILLTRVEAFKDWLLTERKTALQTVRGEGYRIVPPSEQAQYAAEEAMRLVRKGLHKGRRVMENTRIDQLSAEEKRRHTDAQIRLAGIGDLMSRQRKDIFKLFLPQNR